MTSVPSRDASSRRGRRSARLELTPPGPEPVAAAARRRARAARGYSCDRECQGSLTLRGASPTVRFCMGGRASQNESPTDCPGPGVPRSGAWAVAGEEVVMGDGQTLSRRALVGAAIAVVMLLLPSMAWGQTPPPADRFQKVVLDDTPGRADEPRRAAGSSRAAHDALRRAADLQPEDGPEHARGDVRRLQARRGGPAERRGRPELRGQPLGLRLLLASAEHAGGRPVDAGHQRG